MSKWRQKSKSGIWLLIRQTPGHVIIKTKGKYANLPKNSLGAKMQDGVVSLSCKTSDYAGVLDELVELLKEVPKFESLDTGAEHGANTGRAKKVNTRKKVGTDPADGPTSVPSGLHDSSGGGKQPKGDRDRKDKD